MTASGSVVLVGTPIGNLGDLAPRAVEALGRADVIVCEDTRRTGRLLAHAGITPPRLVVMNEHTEARAIDKVLALLDAHKTVAVVTDAGMPGVSDPGERLVRAAVGAGHRVEVVPGPTAAITALVVSGLAGGRFCFEGFLPRKGSGRSARLRELAAERRTIVLYEAPHRLARTVEDLVEHLGGDRPAVIARELTKLHEEIWRGPLSDAGVWAEAGGARGELVLVLEGAPAPSEADDATILAAIEAARGQGLSARDVSASVALELGVSKRRVYELTVSSAD